VGGRVWLCWGGRWRWRSSAGSSAGLVPVAVISCPSLSCATRQSRAPCAESNPASFMRNLCVLALMLGLFAGCQTAYQNLEDRYKRGEITYAQYLALFNEQKARDAETQRQLAAFTASMNQLSSDINAQTQQSVAQQNQILSQSNQQLQGSIQSLGTNLSQIRQSTPPMKVAGYGPPADTTFPTQQQLNQQGNFTGEIRYAADGTMWREYRRLDGSTYWSNLAPGQR